MIEIERKFTVNIEEWNKIDKPLPTSIKQGYLFKSEEKTIRVRTKGTKGYITIKGKTVGISRTEYEYEIPFSEAQELLEQFAVPYLSKDRYLIHHEGHDWEVDVFHGKLAPLVIAEIELMSEDESFGQPQWIKEDVSMDPAYYNANLIDALNE